MSVSELKMEIKKSLDHVPESVLQDVLNYLRHAEDSAKTPLTADLRKILDEDKGLLARLAK